MKQTFTLVLATALSVISAFGQNSQNLETISSLSVLTNNCWQFARVEFAAAAAGNIGNSNNLLAQTTDKRNNAIITTPYVSLVQGEAISIDYKLNMALNGAAKRTVTISLLSYSGVSTLLTSVTLDKNSSTDVATLSVNSPVSDVQKIVFEFSGSGDGNSNMFIDNIRIAGDFNFNSPYGCNTWADGTLPVTLKSFQGLLAADKVKLSWAVAGNENGSYFEMEKSTDGKTFATIATISATGSTGDESYFFIDNTGAKAFYRLKIVSKGKAPLYSNILLMKADTAITNSLSLLQNPVQQTLKFSFYAATAAPSEISVYNTLGVVVYKTAIKTVKGTNIISTELNNTNVGTYILEVKNAGGRSAVKFMKN